MNIYYIFIILLIIIIIYNLNYKNIENFDAGKNLGGFFANDVGGLITNDIGGDFGGKISGKLSPIPNTPTCNYGSCPNNSPLCVNKIHNYCCRKILGICVEHCNYNDGNYCVNKDKLNDKSLSRNRKNAYLFDYPYTDYSLYTLDNSGSPKYCGNTTKNKKTPNGLKCNSSYYCNENSECIKFNVNGIKNHQYMYDGSNTPIPNYLCGSQYKYNCDDASGCSYACTMGQFCSKDGFCIKKVVPNSQWRYNGANISYGNRCGKEFLDSSGNPTVCTSNDGHDFCSKDGYCGGGGSRKKNYTDVNDKYMRDSQYQSNGINANYSQNVCGPLYKDKNGNPMKCSNNDGHNFCSKNGYCGGGGSSKKNYTDVDDKFMKDSYYMANGNVAKYPSSVCGPSYKDASGNGIKCSNSGDFCSKYGYCGKDNKFIEQGLHEYNNVDATLSETQKQILCGPSYLNNICPTGQFCSKDGFCRKNVVPNSQWQYNGENASYGNRCGKEFLDSSGNPTICTSNDGYDFCSKDGYCGGGGSSKKNYTDVNDKYMRDSQYQSNGINANYSQNVCGPLYKDKNGSPMKCSSKNFCSKNGYCGKTDDYIKNSQKQYNASDVVYSQLFCGPVYGDNVCNGIKFCSKDGQCGIGEDYLKNGLFEYKGPDAVVPYDKCGKEYGNNICNDKNFCSKDGKCGKTDNYIKDGQWEYNDPNVVLPKDVCGPSYKDNAGKTMICSEDKYCSINGRCENNKNIDVTNTLFEYNGSNIKLPDDKCGPTYGHKKCIDDNFCSQWNNCGKTIAHKINSQHEYNGPDANYNGNCGAMYGLTICNKENPYCNNNGVCVNVKPLDSTQTAFNYIQSESDMT